MTRVWRWARRHPWTLLWIGWGALFFAIEIPAVLNERRNDTLSEHVWRFLGVKRELTWRVRLRRIGFIAFWGWLSMHFFRRGWV